MLPPWCGPQVSEWGYDAGGRLVREHASAGSRLYAYDVAGELTSVTEPDGSRTEYVYDGLGRRSRLIGPDGSWTEYAWGETGYLQGTVDRTPDGAETARHELWVDALGELASVDSCPVWWDSASPIPTLAGIGEEQVLNLPGGVTGVGEAWIAPGWRAARATDQDDPWAVLGASVIPEPGTVSAGPGPGAIPGMAGGLPAGIGLTGDGGLDIAGLEWLGARAYDPGARGFLSTDPLAPVLGAGWDGNPYSYAGNNPLNASDPTGLRPLTDEDLKAYDASSRGALAAAGDWVKDNWEYIVGGAAIIGGAALMFVPGGQVFGAGLISFGADVVIQKATTGDVNWVQAGISGGLGMAGAGVGMIAGRMVNNPVIRMAVENGVEGAITGAGDYYNGPGPHTASGALRAAATGGATSAAPIGGLPYKKLGDFPVTVLDPADVRFSQRNVNELQGRIDNMAKDGWKDFSPADVVIMPDGGYTTLDHRRVLAARYTDNPVYAHVHHHSDSFADPTTGDRFPATRGPNKGLPANTWGQAVENRIGKQGSVFRNAYPEGSPFIGWSGD